MPRELETVAVMITPMIQKRKRGRPPLSPEEKQRRLDQHFPLDINERLRRERISKAMRIWHASQGHQCSTDAPPMNQAASLDLPSLATHIPPPSGSA